MTRLFAPPSRHAEQGFLLPFLTVSLFIITFVMIAAVQSITHSYDISMQDTSKLRSQLAADAGADYVIEQVLENSSWNGTSGEVTLSNQGSFKTTYEAVVTTAPNGQMKTIDVTGKTYSPVSSATPESTSKVQVTLKGNGASGVDGSISAYIGTGGLIMTGSSAVTNGIVYSNGPIVLTGAAHIGSSSKTVDTYSANMSCPVGGGTGYPRLCNAGENNNPINLPNYGTFIYGQVKANNQIKTNGMINPGLVAGSVSPSDLPDDNRASLVNAVIATNQTQTGAVAGCAGATTKTWPAGLKIVGDVTVSSGCSVTVAGDVWITGNLVVSDAAKLIVQGGLTIPPHILVDGSTGFQLQNSGALIPNAGGTGFRVITYYSTNPCSVSVSGCTVTGSDLYSSQSLLTIAIAGSTQSLKTQYYARWSMVQLDGSADVGALIGQTLRLNGAAEIHSGVAIDPSQPGSLTWTVNSYKRMF